MAPRTRGEDVGSERGQTAAARQTPAGVVFDMDGVLLDTARLHARAWKEMFDEFLGQQGEEVLFGSDDYRNYVDGRPRYRGVASFLDSRGVELPAGSPSDSPGRGTEAALGNRKNQIFLELLDETEIQPLPGVEDLLDALRVEDTPVAVVSSSRNTERILPPEVDQRVDVVLGGVDLDELGIAGKPQPDMFVKAAHLLDLGPESVAVVEDSTAGVVAGRRGGFALVVGVTEEDRPPSIAELADVIVAGVSELPNSVSTWSGMLSPPPNAFDHLVSIRRRVDDEHAPLYVGDDESELLSVREADGVGVLVDPEPPPMTWADFHVPDRDAGADLFVRVGADQPGD